MTVSGGIATWIRNYFQGQQGEFFATTCGRTISLDFQKVPVRVEIRAVDAEKGLGFAEGLRADHRISL
jgi:hypothetical protein